MKLQYLGTAAFEGVPALFCDCPVCTEAKKRGGRNIKTRSQAIIDDTLLVDFPADTYMHYLEYDIPLWDIKTCIITHSHSDHLYAEDLVARQKGYSGIKHDTPFTVYGGRDTYDKVTALNIPATDVAVKLVNAFEPFIAEGYTITPLSANHAPQTSPYIYIIEKDGKTLLYSNDTGRYPEETLEFLKGFKKKFDLVSFDCTKGFENQDYDCHMSMDECSDIRGKLCEMGLCDEHTRCILTHFSHNGKGGLHDDMVKAADKAGFEVAYDGMVVEF